MENEIIKPDMNDNVDILLRFVQDTKDGKFTVQVPSPAEATYQRMEIQEQSVDVDEFDQEKGELILFGISQ